MRLHGQTHMQGPLIIFLKLIMADNLSSVLIIWKKKNDDASSGAQKNSAKSWPKNRVTIFFTQKLIFNIFFTQNTYEKHPMNPC